MSRNKVTDYFKASADKKTAVDDEKTTKVRNNRAAGTAIQSKEILEATIQDQPFRPPPDYCFPKSKCGDRQRSCQTQWFQQFPWLHYDKR